MKVIEDGDSTEGMASVTFTSTAGIKGAVLRSVRPNLAGGGRAEFITFRDDTFTTKAGTGATLPAGDYRFFLLVDRSPGTATLRIPGRTGPSGRRPAAGARREVPGRGGGAP